MVRDRLAELQKEADEEQEDSVEVYDADQDQVRIEVDDEGPAPEDFMKGFFDRVKVIRDRMADMETKIQRIDQCHRDLLLAVKKEQDKEDELQNLMDQISSLANKIRKDLKIIEKQNKELEDELDGQLNTNLRIRKSQHSTLSRKFVQIMTSYNDIQSSNQKKLREKLERQIRIVDPELPREQVEKIIEGGTEGIFTGRRLAEAQSTLSEIQDRHEDIMKLERSLQELHEMFLDMAILVSSQGEMIDRIEFSVEQSQDYVRGARVATKRAEQLQSAARRKQIWIAICCIILIVILVAIIASVIPN